MRRQMYIVIALTFAGLVSQAVLPSAAFAAYVTSGTVTSANLLSGTSASSITDFYYNISSLPSTSSVTIQFSTTTTQWYSSANVLNGSDTLSTTGGATLSLSALAASGTAFYYKMTINATSDQSGTPVISNVRLDYVPTSGYGGLLAVSSSGLVGIGTASPSAKLDVEGGNINVGAAGAYLYNSINAIIASTTLNNWFFGGAGNLTATGSNNLGLGTGALLNNTGSGNVALGYGAGKYYTSSNGFFVNNVDEGSTAADKAYSLLYGTFSGSAGSLTGQQLVINGNVGIGTSTPDNLLSVYQLIDFNNTDFNTKLGYQAGSNIVTGAQYNTFVGYQAGLSSATLSTTAAADNTAMGYQSLSANTTGYNNSAVGYQSLFSNTTGYQNSAQGSNSLGSNSSGYNNTAQGVNALFSNTTGYDNVALGMNALSHLTGSYNNNTALGEYAGNYYNGTTGSLTQASNSTFLGAGTSALNATGDTNETVIGYNAIGNGSNTLTLGGAGTVSTVIPYGNVGIGTTSPYSLLSISNSASTPANTPLFSIASTTGGIATTVLSVTPGTNSDANFQFGSDTNAWDIGYNATSNSFNIASSTGLSNNIALTILKEASTNYVGIGTTTPATLLEVGGDITDDNVINCNGGTTALATTANGKLYCETGISSDQRLKTNITALSTTTGLAAIDALNPVSFNYINPSPYDTGMQFGLIAQQVQNVFPNLVQVTAPTALTPDGTLVLNYYGLIAPMILSIQELDSRFSVPANATSTPPAVLTADGKGIDLYKLATYVASNIATLTTSINGLNTRMTSLETRVTALENGTVSSSSNSPVTFSTSTLASALNSFGVFIQNGVAQFGILVADQFVAATNSAGNSSAGSVTILAGNTVAQVTNAYVKPSSKIFVTFTASTTGSWFISDKQNGSFKLALSAPQTSDVSFDYFIVQTEGQIATSTPISNGNTNTNDTTPPVITILGDNPMNVPVNAEFVDPGVTVTDTVDGTDPVVTYINGMQEPVSSTTIDTSSPTTYIITYEATDTTGNIATAHRAVVVGNSSGGSSGSSGSSGSTSSSSTPASSDTTPPVVTLNGAAAMQINVGDTFTDPGATATDNVDGNLTAKIVETGSVDTTTAGLYTLTYTATDAASNTASVSRVVTVIAATPVQTSTTTSTTDATTTP